MKPKKMYEQFNNPTPPVPWWVRAVQLTVGLAVVAFIVGVVDLLIIAFS